MTGFVTYNAIKVKTPMTYHIYSGIIGVDLFKNF